MRISEVIRAAILALALAFPSSGRAALQFETGATDDGLNFIVVAGSFAFDDDLSTFSRLVNTSRAGVVTFNSGGGNISKAMELGRLIRKLGLTTLQIRSLECASACSLAFMGGVARYAEPGAIGVHKSSFSPDANLNANDAVSLVQQLTADILAYMTEMGIDPRLMQLALKTEANDIRYLSGREMAEFHLTSNGQAGEPRTKKAETSVYAPPPAVSAPSTQPDQYGIPVARSGRVRHPKGSVLMKGAPNSKAFDIARIPNGSRVEIIGSNDRWYHVRSSGHAGYMHHTWVRVDQFASPPGLQRLIQIKSFDNIEDALTYARTIGVHASVFLATNGWFAVTLAEPYERDDALKVTRGLKQKGLIPDDSFVTLGNTYVTKLCCSQQSTSPLPMATPMPSSKPSSQQVPSLSSSTYTGGRP